jgi:2-amino-4-hydroxy-6-hydroxymethyldihydropteridine diphosphokinase
VTVCLLGLGSNLGDRTRNLDLAVDAIGVHASIDVDAVSRYHATVPIGGPQGQGEFLNAVLRLRTALSPEELMRHLLDVEHRLGRRRTQRWGPRTIDLDVLLFGQHQRKTPDLRIPHPRMAFRRFVLQPAVEIAAEMVHPEIDWTIARLLEHLDAAPPYIAVAGLPKAGKTHLAAAVSDRCGVKLITDPLATLEKGPARDGGRDDSTMDWDVLDVRSRVLRRGGPADGLAESISDFWIEQTRAYAETWLSDAEQVRYRGDHAETVRHVVPPKLLVLLELAPCESLSRLRKFEPAAEGWDERRLEMLQRQLEDLACAPRRQPLLRVAAETPSQAVDDVLAAIETMR